MSQHKTQHQIVESNVEAYALGLRAGYRTEEYEGAKTIPKCPYSPGTEEYVAWDAGFGDATEDIIAINMGETK